MSVNGSMVASNPGILVPGCYHDDFRDREGRRRMDLNDLALLRCVECGGDLTLQAGDPVGSDLRQGTLRCAGCTARYPVIDGVGVFFRPAMLGHHLTDRERQVLGQLEFECAPPAAEDSLDQRERAQLTASRNWEFQWTRLWVYGAADLMRDPEDYLGENQFWRFIPLDADDLEDRTALVACGGGGREAFHVSRRGIRKLIFNEIGAQIYGVAGLLPECPEPPLLLRYDLIHSPLRPGSADVVICDHALHELPDRDAAFDSLVQAARPGGKVAVCVKSHENNGLLLHAIEPAKFVLGRLPLALLYRASAVPSALAYAATRLVYAPLHRLSEPAFRLLPLHDQMLFWSHNTFDMIWVGIFDLLHSPTTYHYREHELRTLFESRGLRVEVQQLTNQTMWSVVGVRSPEVQEPA